MTWSNCLSLYDVVSLSIPIKPTKVGQQDWGEAVEIHLVVSLRFIWTHLDSLGPTWIHLDSLGFTRTHLDSLKFTRTHLNSLREKGRAIVPKGKRETHRITFEMHFHLASAPRARTHDTKRFPGYGGACLKANSLPPTSDLDFRP